MAGSSPSSWYDSDPASGYIGEGGSAPVYDPPIFSPGSIYTATREGRVINPARVNNPGHGNWRCLWCGQPVPSTITSSSVGVLLRTTVAMAPLQRSPCKRLQMAGFSGYARDQRNGGRTVQLPAVLGNRAMEAQRVRYDDLDGDSTTDEHAYALPLFIDPTGVETDNYPSTTGAPVIESPGQYLRCALGAADLYMVRDGAVGSESSFDGWRVTRNLSTGAQAGVDTLTQVGLIIRERPVPDPSYFTAPNPTAPGGHYYMPFAYGKHLRSQVWPFWVVDVTSRRSSDLNADAAGTIRSPNSPNDYGRWNLKV